MQTLLQKRFFLAEKLLHTDSDAFTFFRGKLFHREAFTQRSLSQSIFCTQAILQEESLTHRSSCTEKPFHRAAFTHRRFDAEQL